QRAQRLSWPELRGEGAPFRVLAKALEKGCGGDGTHRALRCASRELLALQLRSRRQFPQRRVRRPLAESPGGLFGSTGAKPLLELLGQRSQRALRAGERTEPAAS